MLAFVRDGDTVLVHSMDRLARNLDDLRTPVPHAHPVKCAGAIRQGAAHSYRRVQTPPCPAAVGAGAFDEFEGSLIRKRQREGIAPPGKRCADLDTPGHRPFAARVSRLDELAEKACRAELEVMARRVVGLEPRRFQAIPGACMPGTPQMRLTPGCGAQVIPRRVGPIAGENTSQHLGIPALGHPDAVDLQAGIGPGRNGACRGSRRYRHTSSRSCCGM